MDKHYMVPFGLLKIIEFIFTLISWVTVVAVYDPDSWAFDDRITKPAFHIAICVIACAFTIISFLLNACGVQIAAHKILNAFIHFILGVLVLIAASLLVDVFSSRENYDTYKTGGAFGIISGLVLICESFVHLLREEVTEDK